MLTISGLGYDYPLSRDSGDSEASRMTLLLQQGTQAQLYTKPTEPMVEAQLYTKPSGSSGCQAPDVMSEFGCLTAKIPMPGSVPRRTIYGCPPDSQPYSATHCLRTGNVEADRIAAAAAAAAAATAAAAAAAKAAAEAAAKAQADADATAAAATDAASQLKAQQQQAYADDVAQAAAAAMDAWVATHGASPSPGMTVTPIVDPTQEAVPSWTVTDERKRWYKWGAIGAGALGIGLLAALLARR
jgi:hypothetical protein